MSVFVHVCVLALFSGPTKEEERAWYTLFALAPGAPEISGASSSYMSPYHADRMRHLWI